jgi:hypothetical protein
VWRYPQAVNGFNPPASEYFTPQTPNISHGVSIAFDKTALYILQAGGSVLKFDLQANAQKFTIHVPTAIATPTRPTAMYTDVNLDSVWIADPADGQILQLDKSGNYIRSYQSGSGVDLHHIASFAIGPAGNAIYVLSGKKLYDFPVQH